jgi:hypothetical protein
MSKNIHFLFRFIITLLKMKFFIINKIKEYLFFDDYISRKDTLETKKCKNVLRRISLHWNVCPWCKHSDYLFNEEYLYDY